MEIKKEVIQSILDGKYEVGVIRTGMLEKLSSKGIIDISNLKVINEKKTKYPIKISTKLYPEWSLSRTEYFDIHLANRVFKVLNDIKPTDIEAIKGEYYHWHLAQSHKDIDRLFRKLEIGHYKDMAKYKQKDLINVAVVTSLFVILIFVLVILFIKYKYANKSKNILFNNLSKKEKEVNKLQERFSLVAETAFAGYWEWNLNTNYIYFSEGWKKFLGYKYDEIKNNLNTFKTIIHPDDLEPTMNIVNNYIKKKKGIYKTKFRLKHKNGEYKWVSAVGSIVNGGQNIFFGFHIDIDDLTTTKETLIAQSKSATMGEMISLIAHQFKQPLGVISVNSSTFLLNIELNQEISNEQILKSSKSTLSQVEYLSKTIDTFKNFLKPDLEKTFINV